MGLHVLFSNMQKIIQTPHSHGLTESISKTHAFMLKLQKI